MYAINTNLFWFISVDFCLQRIASIHNDITRKDSININVIKRDFR